MARIITTDKALAEMLSHERERIAQAIEQLIVHNPKYCDGCEATRVAANIARSL